MGKLKSGKSILRKSNFYKLEIEEYILQKTTYLLRIVKIKLK